jgi:hypothetical protein
MRQVDQRGKLEDAQGSNRYDLDLDGGEIQIEMRPEPEAGEQRTHLKKNCCLVQDLHRNEMNSDTAARPGQ